MTPHTAPLLDLPGIGHGFFDRQGGVSEGLYESLNCGTGSRDAPAAVAENRARVAASLGAQSLVSLAQVHSAIVHTVGADWDGASRPEGDGLVTKRPGVALGILTADCAPVLFADRDAGVIGAAHAGWKGAIGGVTDATIAAMVALGAERGRIVAAVGPCIAQASYEVDAGFARRFEDHDPENERFFAAGRADHFQFDLEGYVARRLAVAGVTRVELLGADTYAQPDRFYSYRRATHRGEPDYGRQISLIGL